MSFSKIKSIFKNICNICKSRKRYRWDSFSDRVCDDLSEVILQFLPIDDKFRFECVSKQFQRTVYQRHYELIVTKSMRRKHLTLKSILKKLSHIKSLKTFIGFIPFNDSEIELIIKYCKHLIEFDSTLREISDKYKLLFADKFGSQLTSITFCDLSLETTIDSFVNIQEIEFKRSIIKFKVIINFYSKIKSKNLKKVSIDFNHSFSFGSISYLKTFIEKNRSITHLSICDQTFLDNYPIEVNLTVISRLNQLISLKLVLRCIEHKTLINGLKQLSLNCPKLKSLSLTFTEIIEELEINCLLSGLKEFKDLKQLVFQVFFTTLGDSSEYQFEDNFINSLKTGFEELSHLMIRFGYYVFNETFIEYIVKYLPKLQNLIIENPIKVNELTVDILSRLSTLESLELYILEDGWGQTFKSQVLEKCRKIKSIVI